MAAHVREKLMGVHEMYRPSDTEANVDIVAIHGLNGDAIQTWTAQKSGVCWLKDPDYLPKHIPNARVLAYGYNSSISSLTSQTPSSDRIHHHAHTLVQELCADRRLAKREHVPIIFLCHSLGGIIVKRALSYSKEKTAHNVSHLHKIYTCTYGILFFGTPHNGSSESRLLGTLQKLASTTSVLRKPAKSDSDLVKALHEESETLQNINDYFMGMAKRFRIHLFWEQQPTVMGKNVKDYVVSKESAAPSSWPDIERAGIAADHLNMVRFQSNTSQGYRLAISALDMYCTDAPQVIAKRCTAAIEHLNQAWQNEAYEQSHNIPHEPTRQFSHQTQHLIQSREQLELLLATSEHATRFGPRTLQSVQAADIPRS